ncbi:hypothetical protein SH528x_007158 [Novipirellula sp. SH528]|uniref:hypothetical protein n=1 Tax=Novipirellula sp. SH528 TaxID=3454466 RepID=UPI003FA0E98E
MNRKSSGGVQDASVGGRVWTTALEKMDQIKSMPWQLAASSSRTSRVLDNPADSESRSTAMAGLVVESAFVGHFAVVGHFAEAPEQQPHETAGLSVLGSPFTSETRKDFRVRAIKKAGGWTWLSAAHCNFSASLWQQHLSQQYSAVEQPQGQFSQGKRPFFSGMGAEIGNPVIPHANTINSVTLMTRRRVVDRRE